jgi:hypothetical protein
MDMKMRGNLRIIVGVSIGISILLFLIYWAGLASPKKEMVLKKELNEDMVTGEVLTLYEVFYKWDGVEQQVPWWIMYQNHGEWMVLEFKNFDPDKGPEENRKHAVKFDLGWIEYYKFLPQSTRYQMVLKMLGFQPTYDEEKKVFFEILH